MCGIKKFISHVLPPTAGPKTNNIAPKRETNDDTINIYILVLGPPSAMSPIDSIVVADIMHRFIP